MEGTLTGKIYVVSSSAFNNVSYSEYIAEKLDNNVSYSEYIAEKLDNNIVGSSTRMDNRKSLRYLIKSLFIKDRMDFSMIDVRSNIERNRNDIKNLKL